jgi:hypothetical protein
MEIMASHRDLEPFQTFEDRGSLKKLCGQRLSVERNFLRAVQHGLFHAADASGQRHFGDNWGQNSFVYLRIGDGLGSNSQSQKNEDSPMFIRLKHTLCKTMRKPPNGFNSRRLLVVFVDVFVSEPHVSMFSPYFIRACRK